jgi:hypothetical protein
VKRKVNVKKLFSDEESEEIPVPTNPRRQNVLPSSSFDDPSQLTSNLPTKNRYENDISNIDDYETEERRRLLARQNQVKMSDMAAQTKRATSRKKSMNTIEVEKVFDSSEYIFTEKTVGKRTKTGGSEKSNLQQPKQPKRERSLTSQSDEVRFF